MPVNEQQYLDELLAEAGVAADDPRRQAITEVFIGNEKAKKKWSGDVMRQSDYSRAQDQLRVDKEKTAKYYQDLVTWNATQEQAYKDALAAAGGQQQQVIQQVQPDELVKLRKEFETRLTESDGKYVTILEQAMEIASSHPLEFKESLTPERIGELKKISAERNVSLRQAYNEWVTPRRSETSAAQRKTELDNARAEGARDALSKHHIPTDAKPPEYRVLLDRDPKKQVGADDYVANSGVKTPQMERQLKENFAAAWDSAQSTTSSTT